MCAAKCLESRGQEEPRSFASSGECPDENATVKQLWARIASLETENRQLAQENSNLHLELQNRDKALNAEQEGADAAADGGSLGQTISDEALRKRLERICKRDRNGKLSCTIREPAQKPLKIPHPV